MIFHLDEWKTVPLTMQAMEHISTVRDLVALWPSRLDFAMALNVPVDRVHKWIASGSIPAKHHMAILDCAHDRSLPVSATDMVLIHDERRIAADNMPANTTQEEDAA